MQYNVAPQVGYNVLYLADSAQTTCIKLSKFPLNKFLPWKELKSHQRNCHSKKWTPVPHEKYGTSDSLLMKTPCKLLSSEDFRNLKTFFIHVQLVHLASASCYHHGQLVERVCEAIESTAYFRSFTTFSISWRVDSRPMLSRMALMATSSGIPIDRRMGEALFKQKSKPFTLS